MARKTKTEDCGGYLVEQGSSVNYLHSCREEGTKAGGRCIKDLLLESGLPANRLKQYGVCRADRRTNK